jgi:hypothetical protein
MNADNPLVNLIGVTVRPTDFRGTSPITAAARVHSSEITKGRPAGVPRARSPFVAN